MSSGAFAPDSRLARLICAPVSVRPKLYVPFPITRAVTSTETKVPDVKLPDEPVTVFDIAGAFE